MAGHILLAEDDKALSALMQDFFRAAGVTVTPAYDGEQALVLAQEQKLQPCLLPALGVPVQARGNDLGVVDDQNVLRGNIVRDIIEMPVFDRTVRPVDDHEPGGVPAVGGMLGYQLRGQVVGEIRGLQICSDALVENNVRLYCIHICGTSLTVR